MSAVSGDLYRPINWRAQQGAIHKSDAIQRWNGAYIMQRMPVRSMHAACVCSHKSILGDLLLTVGQ